MSRQYNIRWTESDNEELRKVVKNFNAKISRLEKKNPELKDVLPERASVKDIKKLVDTRQDLKRELNSLRRFTKRGSEEVVDVPDNEYNLKITKWQKKEMTMREGIINRKKKKRLKELEELEMTSRGEKLGYKKGEFGMGKVDKNALKPTKAFPPKMDKYDLKAKDKTLKKQSQSTYFDKKDMRLKANYIRGLELNYNAEDLKKIIKSIEDMDFKEFYKRWQAEGGTMEFASHTPNEEEYSQYIEALQSTWLD